MAKVVVFEFRALSFSFSSKEANLFNNISFELNKGEAIAILGPSGSGKSTLLKLSNRLLECPIGSIFYKGADIKTKDPLSLRREVLYLPQLPYLIQGSVSDNLKLASFGNPSTGFSEFSKALSVVGLSEQYLLRDAMTLSVGEKQRVALARTLLIKNASILLLDEPNSSLDEANSLILIRTFKGLLKLGYSIIMTTHQPLFASSLGASLLRLNNGRLLSGD